MSITKQITFYPVTAILPNRKEIRMGIYAQNRMSGDWIRIPTTTDKVDSRLYSSYAPVDCFPSTKTYDPKFADLMRAKDILKDNKWTGDGYEIGKAIYLIKKYIESQSNSN